jgi:hypothetical protein
LHRERIKASKERRLLHVGGKIINREGGLGVSNEIEPGTVLYVMFHFLLPVLCFTFISILLSSSLLNKTFKTYISAMKLISKHIEKDGSVRT